MKTTAADIRKGWQADPFGEHELRLFSPEGRPTAHVSTNGRNSYEEMPGAVIVDAPRAHAIRPTKSNGAPGSPARSDIPPPARAWGGGGQVPIGHIGPRVRMHQLARIVVAVTVITTFDRARRACLVFPSFFTVLLAARTKVPARRDSLEPTGA
jgi:hypothetical protein